MTLLNLMVLLAKQLNSTPYQQEGLEWKLLRMEDMLSFLFITLGVKMIAKLVGFTHWCHLTS